MNFYKAFQLRVAADLEFPELLAAEPGEPDVVFRREEIARDEPLAGWKNQLCADGSFTVEDQAVNFRMVVRDNATVVYDAAAEWMEPDGRTHLLSHGFAALMYLRGHVPLHANVLRAPSRNYCIAIAGARGAGKSTTSLKLMGRGWRLVSDDLCVTRLDPAAATALPGFPRLKLWPSTLAAFGYEAAEYSRLWRGQEKRHFPLDRKYFDAAEAPLSDVFVLEASAKSESVTARGVVGLEKVMLLRPHLMAAASQGVDQDPGRLLSLVARLSQFVRLTVVQRPIGKDSTESLADVIESRLAKP